MLVGDRSGARRWPRQFRRGCEKATPDDDVGRFVRDIVGSEVAPQVADLDALQVA